MAVVKWDPWQEIEDMFDRYTRAVGWPRRGAPGVEPGSKADWAPRVDISETDAEFSIKAELPEVRKDDVKITIDNGVVTLQGERKQETEQKGKTFHRVERYYGSFSRSFALPDNIDDAKARATFHDGVLTLQIPKRERAQPKGVEIRVE